MRIRPILFNTDMVRAILDGRKTVTRRVVKLKYGTDADEGTHSFDAAEKNRFRWSDHPNIWTAIPYPYHPGDILYVRETWALGYDGGYIYKADDKLADLPYFQDSTKLIYRPSIHMPCEAARIFLLVTDVRVERLKDMTSDSAWDEGFTDWNDVVRVWNGTIKPADRNRYGWGANPWVWVIEFERISREEAQRGN